MLFIAMALALHAAPPPATSPYAADPECGDYGDGSTVAMVECYSQQAKLWDKRLNDQYQAALKRADKSQLGPLRAAQRLWVRYRNANCEMYYRVDGSISRILAARCSRDMPRDRALELREMSWSG